uniref:Uncharacterized protein n=1 Tax=Panagrolaimus davidi TaxID=227884 RepID=A0A914PZZ2_9BILA
MFLPILTFLTNKSETLNVFNLFPKHEEYDASINAVGIDFGTSECCAFVIRKHGPDGVVLDPLTKLRTVPTYTTIGTMSLCGQIVYDRIEYNVQQTAFNIKRLLGKNVDEIIMDPLWSFNIVSYYNQITLFGGSVGNNTWSLSSVAICTKVLYDIKSKIDEYQGCLLQDVVITIPSCYDERQKDATIDAAEFAGWKRVELLSEPIAAAFAYSYDKEIPNNSIILLFDCGGGTTDICIGKVLNEKLEILCQNGDFFIGGNDFDKFLIDYFNEILKEKYNFDALNSTKKYRLMRKCREIKHFLSAHETDKLDVDDFIFDHDDVIPITREIFEDLADTLIVKAKNLIAETLAKAKVNHSDIKIVYQVGGGCRVPMIKRMLLEIFPNAIHECSVNPEWMVAKGAALYSYFLKTKNKVGK